MADEWEQLVSEYKEKAKKIRDKVKLTLFDLYDLCLLPIARVLDVDFNIDTTGKFGDTFTVKIGGQRLLSQHFEAVKQVAEEVFQKEVSISFSITFQEKFEAEPLLAEIIIRF